MKIADRLSKEQKQQMSKSSKKKQPTTKPKKKEQLSIKDIEELMGIHIDTYTRRNGAVRRR